VPIKHRISLFVAQQIRSFSAPISHLVTSNRSPLSENDRAYQISFWRRRNYRSANRSPPLVWEFHGRTDWYRANEKLFFLYVCGEQKRVSEWNVFSSLAFRAISLSPKVHEQLERGSMAFSISNQLPRGKAITSRQDVYHLRRKLTLGQAVSRNKEYLSETAFEWMKKKLDSYTQLDVHLRTVMSLRKTATSLDHR
jgi:hypothetical protein